MSDSCQLREDGRPPSGHDVSADQIKMSGKALERLPRVEAILPGQPL